MVKDFSAGGGGMALIEAIRHEVGPRRAVSFEEELEQAKQNRPRR